MSVNIRLIEEYTGNPIDIFYSPEIEITDHDGKKIFVTIDTLRYKFKTKAEAFQAAFAWFGN